MTKIATATATDARQLPAGVNWAIHGAAALWIAVAFLVAHYAPDRYTALLQEDGMVEWWTAALFAAAGLVRLPRAWRERRVFDLLIAAFCIFVAGEEFSWGQRLFGFTPPDLFLEHNTQQEFTLHNFADVFGKPKGVLIAALVGYALLAWPKLHRLRATPPTLTVVPWLLGAALLLYWYPLEFTGEWVEALAGGMFLVSGASARGLARALPLTIIAAALLTLLSRWGSAGASPGAVACAQREVQALLGDITEGGAMPDLATRRRGLHKRVWSAVDDGYIDDDALLQFRRVGCGQSQRYAVDPWGMAYWIRVGRDEAGRRTVRVYSMGPNRRRDGDDIGAGFPISEMSPSDM